MGTIVMNKNIPTRNWETIKFPCHGIFMRDSCGTEAKIFKVLFFAPNIGIVVEKKSNSASPRFVGEFDNNWSMTCFDPCPPGTSTTFITD